MLDKHKRKLCLITVATSRVKCAVDGNYQTKANFHFYNVLRVSSIYIGLVKFMNILTFCAPIMRKQFATVGVIFLL